MQMRYLVGEAMTGGYGDADILHDCTIGVDEGEIAVVVGGYAKTPLGIISFIENLLMAIMSVLILIK